MLPFSALASQPRPANIVVPCRWVAGTLPKTERPVIRLYKNPAIEWRGVHLFVGPQALAFQSRLIQMVLKPLGFNRVVLECERTNWKSTPGLKNEGTISREDLVKLFALYRTNGIEPIPLIESFGHMRWLLGNKKNAGLAYNGNPNTINPLNPKSRELLSKIWAEAVDLLHPKVVHFGFDEIGLPTDPKIAGPLWSAQMSFVSGLAKRLHVQPMFWGDQMLGPREGPDSCNAPSVQIAQARRNTLPKGALIGDWHYVDSGPFSSLGIWKNAGQQPIASTWSRPRNIAAFTLAAQQAGAGTLITTWAGYSSDEQSMLSNADQFAAFVLAGETNNDPQSAALITAIAGKDAVYEDARTLFQSLYFGPTELGGQGWIARFAPQSIKGGSTARIACGLKGSALLIDLSNARNEKEGRVVASVEIDYSDGTNTTHSLAAGWDVPMPHLTSTFRAQAGTTRLTLRPVPIRNIRVQAIGRANLLLKSLEIAK